MAEKLYLSNCGDKVVAELTPPTEVCQENRFSEGQIGFLKSLGLLDNYEVISLVLSMGNGIYRRVFSIIPKNTKTILTDADVVFISTK